MKPCAPAVSAALTAGSTATVASLAFNADLSYLVAALSDAGPLGAAALASLAPSPAALLVASPGNDVSGLIATTRGGDGVILSRFFGPWLGIDEDSATGSAHAVLAPLWLMGEGNGSSTATPARQLSARGGELTVALCEGGARVAVGGRARVVVRGQIDV